MGIENRFSVLLVVQHKDDLESLCNMVKRHFPHFFIAFSEEEALSIITEQKIDVLLMGLNTIQENEIFYLHLLSAKKSVDKILFRKIVFCSREDLKEAFSICNKDVFDDYFIVRPLYDPYHLLLRLRFIRRTQQMTNTLPADAFSVESLCEYLDQIVSCDGDIKDLNAENYEKLMSLMSFSMEQMREKVIKDSGVAESHHSGLRSAFDNHAQGHIQQVGEHQRAANQQVEERSQAIADVASVKKERILEDSDVVFDDSNILLLEDEATERDKIKAILDSGGYKAQVSGCATHTMKLLNSWKPDVVLMDLTLPDMSALFVIDQIRQDPDMEKTRIMVLAKPGDNANVQEAMRMGVHEVMLKPVDRDMLLYKMGHNLQALKANQ